MMSEEFFKMTAEMMARGESFVTATVVRCQAPSSGKPGDKAVIHPDGRISGWIGGGCAQPVVVKEALKALLEGRPKLVRISPSPNDPTEGTVDYTMTCHSGGALDIYLEPVLPKPRILILGRSPVARMLAQLGNTIGYGITIVSAEAMNEDLAGVELVANQDFNLEGVTITPQTFVVVSTQGEGDEEAVEKALKSSATYVAFVASKTKAGKVLEFLQGRGLGLEQLRRLRAPAGLDIGARSPEEIAVSILAEIVQMRTNATKAPTQGKAPVQTKASSPLNVISTEAKDPVCGMTVDTTKARYKSEFQGKAIYFCCAGCRQAFDQAPERYVLVNI
jgi:xanthine dehydrogenase accessory factor